MEVWGQCPLKTVFIVSSSNVEYEFKHLQFSAHFFVSKIYVFADHVLAFGLNKAPAMDLEMM